MGIFVDANFEFETLEKYSIFCPRVFESIFVKIKTDKNKFYIVGNIYRPNTSPLANIKRFNNELESLLIEIKNDPLFKLSLVSLFKRIVMFDSVGLML